MGCPYSVEVEKPKQVTSEVACQDAPQSQPRYSLTNSVGASILIQKWYRRYRARLEVRRRCAWMIYQSLEYAGEQDHLKLYTLFTDLISQADSTSLVNTVGAEDSEGKISSREKDKIWCDDWIPPIPQNYEGPVLVFPLDTQQLMSLMISLSHKKKKRIHPRYLYKLLSEAKQVLASRPNIQKASTSISKQITVVGDLHGQLADLQTILHKNGLPDVTNPYIFNGDFVDRGRCSVETMVIILTLMLLRPTAVYLNRGNHEDYYVNCQYGFVKEIQKKYKSQAGPIVKCFTDLFRYLPLATIINDTMLVTHGGISNEMDLMVLKSLDRTAFVTLLKPLNKIAFDIEEKRQYQDLLWSDPVAQMGTRPNDLRGLGCFFGPDVSKSFLQKANLQLLIRSHECRPEGFEWMHDNRVLTVFSASNYYTEGSNKGAYAKILSDGTVHPVQFTVSGGRKHKSMRQRINSAEEAALTDLKKKIAAHSDELSKEFHAADPDRTGQIPIPAWITAMQNVLELKLPWRTLQPRLTDTAKEKNMVLYETMFEKTKVLNSLTKAPAPLTEELYKQRDTLEGIFRAMDKDGSGHISLAEFQAACLRLPNRAHIDEKSISDMARSIDLNKDGQIDFNEFLEAFRLAELEVGKQEQDSEDVYPED
ncbi:hypothetical protein CRM22_008783 [Opisthorchis felineus]|uniref:Serine/threonine-protein phosphatase with EF-hands n=1 Tax=Opisthorchis felineus TaxID=147828 RepID=A0A4S2LAD2_OPIFE|nr:hypothetical protein CRM22_008783 [Opisthorchis felineus]